MTTARFATPMDVPTALRPVRVSSRRRAGWIPHVRAAAVALCAVVLVIALALLALGVLTTGATDGRDPAPIPRNSEPSPFEGAP
jgi:hypothetical protein